MKTSSRLLHTTILCGLGAIATPALAQTATPAAATAPADTSAQDSGIGDIIVTAQRRSESVQKVPVAVTAYDQKVLDSPTVADIRDLAGRTPSLVVDSVAAGPSAAAVAIRGISFEDIEKSFDPAVGVVVDGVFIGTNTGQLLDSFDLQRLEVLRGPQGTLFGRNTIGGVISVTRTKPTNDAGVRATIAYSSFDTKRGRLVANTGKIGDFIALKGFVFYDDTAGYYYNVTKKRREGKYETLSGGVTALITPTSDISAEITYEHQRERGETVVASLSQTGRDVICAAPGAPGFAPAVECNRWALPAHGLYTTFENIDTPVSNDTDAVTGNVNVDLGGGFALASVTGYRRNRESVTQDFDASSANFFDTLRKQTFRQFSQELRVVGDVTPWLNLLVGGYYFKSSYEINQSTNLGAVLAGGTPAVLAQYVTHQAKSYAGFADARVKLGEKITLGVGARYTQDDKSIYNQYGRVAALVALSQPTYNGTQCVAVTGVLPSPPFPAGLPAYSAANNCSGSVGFGKFTWRANLNYQIDPSKLVYASYSKGFRSGGFNGRAASPTSLGPYQPETVDAYEIGLKADWLDHKLRTNLAFYITKYSNKQEEIVQNAPAGSANPQETVVKNAASATIKGAELEVIAQPTRGLTFTGTFSYTDAHYDNFLNDVNGDLIPDNVSTLTLRRAPTVQWSTSVDYAHDIGSGVLDLSSTLRYQSKYETCIAPNQPAVIGAVTNDFRCITDDREDLSAQISYTLPTGSKSEVKLSLFGRNLTNNLGLAATLPVAGLLTFGTAKPPRSYGVELGVKF